MGKHEFKYALLPHAGSVIESDVIDEAYAFNMPLVLRATHAAPTSLNVFSTDVANVVIETVKRAEDSDALIVRLYEAHGGRGPVALMSDLPFKKASLCTGLEEETGKLEWKDGAVTLNVTPFQIVTVKLER